MPRNRIAIQGTPGTTHRNDGPRVQWQLIVQWHNSCGRCIAYDHQISTWWPIPFHHGCNCQQIPIAPGAEARPFVDYQAKIQTVDPVQRGKIIGVWNMRLVDRGLASWDDVVTPSRIRSFQDVVLNKKLTEGDLVGIGIPRSRARAALAAGGGPSQAVIDAAKQAELLAKLKAAGMTPEEIAAEVKRRVTRRFGIDPGLGGGGRVNRITPRPPGTPPQPPPAPVGANPAPPGGRPAPKAIQPRPRKAAEPVTIRPPAGPKAGPGEPIPPRPTPPPRTPPKPALEPARPSQAVPKPKQPPEIIETRPEPSTAKVIVTDKVRLEEAQRIVFGKQVDPARIANLAGSTGDDVVVKIQTNAQQTSVIVASSAKTPEGAKIFNSVRVIRRVGRDLVIDNESISIAKTGTGLGTEIMTRQISEAVAMGASQMRALAVRDLDTEGDQYNGYYTWPRMGYDGEIPDNVKARPPEFESAKTVQDLFAIPGGMGWWKQHGDTFDAVFDLRKGSLSRRVFDAYLRERKKRQEDAKK